MLIKYGQTTLIQEDLFVFKCFDRLLILLLFMFIYAQ
jgi:hypothetical protein